MLLAPIATLPLGIVTAAVLVGATLVGVPPLASAALAVGVLALGSRGLHLDGLADTADGLAAGYDRERALSVMRRGDVGPAGAVTLVVTLAAQVACLAALADLRWWAAATGTVAAVTLSRAMLSVVCARGVPAARPDGLGAAVAGSVRPVKAVVAVSVWTGLASGALAAAGWPWWSGALATAAACLVVAVVVRRCISRLGGVTGDVLGAAVEAALTAALVVVAANV